MGNEIFNPYKKFSKNDESQIKEEIKELLRKQPLTPADIASQIEADKEIISQCIRELLEDEDLKAENGIISLKV